MIHDHFGRTWITPLPLQKINMSPEILWLEDEISF